MRKDIRLAAVVITLAACNLMAAPARQSPIPAPAATRIGPNTPIIPTALPTQAAPLIDPAALIQPADLEYLGAFRLPGGDERPKTFAYGGNAMTYNPDGDPSGEKDGFPGSLFVMGHDRIPYGDLPDGNQVAEISLPAPVISKNRADLNTAAFLQDFQNVAAGQFSELDEIPRVGMQYLNRTETGPKIHLAWGAHLHPPDSASHAWFNPTLNDPGFQGSWFIGSQDLYSVNGYMLEIPESWAETYSSGRVLGTGRMRDGGMGGMGPSLFAYHPWQPDGSPAPSGARLEETTLLLYESSWDGSMSCDGI